MDKLSKVKGIGPKSELLLNKIGIYTIDDLVTHFPFRYDVLERTDIRTIDDPNQKIVIDGKVESVPLIIRFKGGLNKLNFRLYTTYGSVGVSIFGRAFLKKNLPVGENIIVIGKYDKSKNILNASDIRFGDLSCKKIEPVYHLTSGITSKNLHTFINLGLLTYGKEVYDYIPDYLLDKYDYSNKKTCLNIIHNPDNLTKLEEVKERLKYEELFVFMSKINYLKTLNKKNIGIERKIDLKILDKLYKLIPFTLTEDQDKVLKEIIDDLNAPKMMNRLLQGDVGSGKTIVSIAAMYFNKLSGYQSALMAPTEILATQHYNNIKKLIGEKLEVRLLIGSLSKKEKLKIYEELETGLVDIVIGTHALIQEDVKYFNLGLVVTDEQHRFGVNQRANLKNKGITPDVLYMSATPIPRTFALTIYGDMDISIIKEMPKGRLPVKTLVKSDEEIPEVLDLMYKELQEKHQIYVIAPLIEGDEESELTSVNDLRDKMNLAFGTKYKIEVLHGKMPNNLKDDIMFKFKENKINILISTTVIEVGVDVPNASMMVIFDANRFGLSTLHQLRGRVGRSDKQSYCILISDSDTKRLEIMESTNDGFKISEEDFKLRGSGDLFGTKQSGDMEFKIASIRKDYDLLLKAREDSLEYLEDEKYDKDKLKQELLSEILDS